MNFVLTILETSAFQIFPLKKKYNSTILDVVIGKVMDASGDLIVFHLIHSVNQDLSIKDCKILDNQTQKAR